MTFLQIVNSIKDTAYAQPNVNTVVREFLDLNREDVVYSAVVIQDRDGERDIFNNQDYITYTFHLGYVDRLRDDQANRDDIFSTGIEVLNNIVNQLRDSFFPYMEVSVVDRFNTFNQRFIADCAGVYIVLAINIPISDCVDGATTDMYDSFSVNITENGVYHYVPSGRAVDEINITVDTPARKEEETLDRIITENGSNHYTPDEGKVFSDVHITTDVHPTSRLNRTYTTNGSKEITGEFNGGNINVNVHPSSSLSVTYKENGVYNVDGEFNGGQVTVNVPGGGKDYRNMKGSIPGLEDLGWDTDSIGYANANRIHYSWEDSKYAVSQANKDLYGVVNKNNKDSYKTNTDMVYVPMFDTSGVTSMYSYFYQFKYINMIPLFDTSSVTNMYGMFNYCYNLITIPKLNTSSVTDMGLMFYGCYSLETLPELDTSSVTNMRQMLRGCSKLSSVPLFDTSSVTDMSIMFNSCSSLVSVPSMDTSSVTNMFSMFQGCSSLVSVPSMDTSSVKNMTSMFQSCSKLVTIPSMDTSSVTNMSNMFTDCSNLVTISSLDTSSVTNTYNMFIGCSNLENITITGNINVSFDISSTTKLTSESVISILQAMSRTVNTNSKTATFNMIIPDPTGDIRNLISVCESNGWTVNGLVIPTGDPVIHYTSKDGNIVTPNLTSGYSIVSNVYENGQGTITFNKYPTAIWNYMYQHKNQLNTIEIPDEVITLGYACLADGCGITSITIPRNVTRLDSYVFSGATDLVEVIMESSTPPAASGSIFNGHNANLVIKVPADAVDTYKRASGWNNYASIIVSQ